MMLGGYMLFGDNVKYGIFSSISTAKTCTVLGRLTCIGYIKFVNEPDYDSLDIYWLHCCLNIDDHIYRQKWQRPNCHLPALHKRQRGRMLILYSSLV